MSDTVQIRWYTNDMLEELYPVLAEGDLLEFQRIGYAHWAVYVGIRLYEEKEQHCVINRAIPVGADKQTLFLASRSLQKIEIVSQKITLVSRSTVKNIGDIHLEDIGSVVGNDRVRINNDEDKRCRPKEPEEIVARAEAALNANYNAPYNLLTNNCEHFAKSCRYGKSRSRQVPDAVKKTAGSLAGVIIPATARGVACAFILPALGIAATGPIGWTITGVSIALGIIGAATPVIVHAIQNVKKK